MILLDTHVLIWMASDPKRLSKKARDAILLRENNSERTSRIVDVIGMTVTVDV